MGKIIGHRSGTTNSREWPSWKAASPRLSQSEATGPDHRWWHYQERGERLVGQVASARPHHPENSVLFHQAIHGTPLRRVSEEMKDGPVQGRRGG